MSVLTSLEQRVVNYKANALYRRRHVLSANKNMQVEREGQTQTVFCSNDYLGLSQHPQLKQALKQGADSFGVSGSSSQLVSGHLTIHKQTEQAFADFLNREAAILFNTGFMANQGVITALAQKGDLILADKLVHASIIDACQLSKATLIRYPHFNYSVLAEHLAKNPNSNKLVVTDSVFSMRGDIADLQACTQLCKQYNATLMVDDAHGIGVLGSDGGGVQSEFNLSQDELPVLVCPLAKGFGVMGAVVAGPKILIDGLVQFARSYTYSNALPGAYAYAALNSLDLVKTETWRREKLYSNIAYFKAHAELIGLSVLPSNTAIQCLQIGDAVLATTISERLLQKGFLLTAMRPPTVPPGQSCLRVTLSTLHEHNQIKSLLLCIQEALHAVSA